MPRGRDKQRTVMPDAQEFQQRGVSGRLAGRIAVVTGAAGNLGGYIVRSYLREGATVVMTGRTPERLEAARAAIGAELEVDESRLATAILDGADPQSVRSGIASVVERFGRIDILINNAGSAGPKQPVQWLPFDADELADLVSEGSKDTETVGAAIRNVFGVAWNVTRAAAPFMPEGGSIINISTIFSRTPYYGRMAYVVPKAAMNAWSAELAHEIGGKGIRVNLVLPGPIASERIRSVFATMDDLRGDPLGTTAAQFFDMMSLERSVAEAARAKTFPTAEDVAATCVFLGSSDSAAFNGHDFEVTHGMAVAKEARSTYLSRPSMRSIDGSGHNILIATGDNWEEALAIATILTGCGAKVLLGLSRQADVAIAKARAHVEKIGGRLEIIRLNRTELAAMETTLEAYSGSHGPITGAVLMPFFGPGEIAGPLLDCSDDTVASFMDLELGGAIALARTLSRYWKRHGALISAPRFVFLSNGSDGAGDVYARLRAAATEQLVRIWRDEADSDAAHGRRPQAEWGNHIVRFSNQESENTRFTAGHVARILLKQNKIREVTLNVPHSISEATGAKKAMPSVNENITGLHLGKVALITGASAGIGGQIAHFLAVAGAKVMMVARRESELAQARARIINELQDIGISGAEHRVLTLGGIDVSDLASLRRALDETIKAFGRIDYLINNAGVSGAEEMVVDMPVDAWNYTIDANLVSNYLLIHHALPHMKAQRFGYVLNVSSYFGGEKYLAVAYPNRADYAVSKAGQRAMVESMARHLGPEVQFNAIAPGPVDGVRLAGTDGRPGLFERRGKLILENRRLNAVHAATVKALRRGVRVETILARLARNDTVHLSHDTNTPHEIRELALACAREGDGVCCWDLYLMSVSVASRLVARLRQGGYFLDAPDWKDRRETKDSGASWLLRAPPAEVPFLPADKIRAEAKKVADGVLSRLYLGKMPKESEVAQATVFFLADRAVSGETFMPSGGLSVERSITERELMGSPKQERLEQMRGRTVWIVGEHLVDYLAESARRFVEDCHVARVVLVTRTNEGSETLRKALADLPESAIQTLIGGDDIEAKMDQAILQWGRPTTVVSTPFRALPSRLFDPAAPLTPKEFRDLIADNLTHHFRIARKASLFDDCQLVLVSPDVPMGDTSPAFDLANFIKTTLHAFTTTLAVENERLVHDVPVNQINLTRRVRSEAPRDLDEYLEQIQRFARAVLLLGAPLPDAEDSRYRARIYRGLAMTV